MSEKGRAMMLGGASSEGGVYRERQWAALGACALFGVMTGWSVIRSPMLVVMPALALVGLGLAMLCFWRRELVFQFALFWTFVQYFLVNDLRLLPGPGVWGDEACLGGLLAASFLRACMEGQTRFRKTSCGSMLLIFMFIGVVGGLANEVQPKLVALGIRGVLQPTLFYVVVLHLARDEQTLRRIVRLLLAVILLQVPLCVVQFLTWHPAMPYIHEDSAFGTFSYGSANLLGLMLIVFIFYFAFAGSLKAMRPILAYAASAALLLAFFLTSARVGFVLIACSLALMILKSSIRSWAKATILIFLPLGFVFLLITLSMLSGGGVVSMDAEALETTYKSQFEDNSGAGRVFFFLDTIDMVHRHSVLPPFGLGPGAYGSFMAFTFRSPLLVKRLGFDIDTPGARFNPDVTVVLGEFGYVGLIVFLAVFIRNYRLNERRLMRVRDPFWRTTALSHRIFSVIMLVGPLSNNVWQCQFIAGAYWILTGVLEASDRLVKEKA